LQPTDIQKTAVIVQLFDFRTLNFFSRLPNAGKTFQRMVDLVFAGLDFVFVYLDHNIIFTSCSEAGHLQDLLLLFQRLRQFGLVINSSGFPEPQGVSPRGPFPFQPCFVFVV
jgi:pentatricopeptide repeat protein